MTQFYYLDLDFPYRVTHIYLPLEDSLTVLVYDEDGNLMYARIQQSQYYIISDQVSKLLITVDAI